MDLRKLLVVFDLVIVSAVTGAYAAMTFAASSAQAVGGVH